MSLANVRVLLLREVSGWSEGWCRAFLLSAGVIFALTGGAKVLGAFGGARLLELRDPLFGLPFRWTMLIAGAMELGVASVCVFRRRPMLSTVLVGWLAILFLVYRLFLWWIEWELSCGCLGNSGKALGVSPGAERWLLNALLAWLLVGSAASFQYHWRRLGVTSHLGGRHREDTNGS